MYILLFSSSSSSFHGSILSLSDGRDFFFSLNIRFHINNQNEEKLKSLATSFVCFFFFFFWFLVFGFPCFPLFCLPYQMQNAWGLVSLKTLKNQINPWVLKVGCIITYIKGSPSQISGGGVLLVFRSLGKNFSVDTLIFSPGKSTGGSQSITIKILFIFLVM